MDHHLINVPLRAVRRAEVYVNCQQKTLREIVAEMLATKSEMPLEKVKELFCSEHGFQTPKLDTRAADFSTPWKSSKASVLR